VGFFIATVEVTIVATALVAITDDLKDFDKASWIVNSYMLAFTSRYLECNNSHYILIIGRFHHHLVQIE
jgi:hypothetical protein